MTLVLIESDWLNDIENCERLAVDINSQIQQRNKELPTSEKYKSISNGIRMRLSQFSGEVKDLRRKLTESRGYLASDDLESRNRQIKFLETKNIQFNNEFAVATSQEIRERTELLQPNRSLWQDDDDDDEPIVGASDREALLNKYSVQKMRQQNEKVLREQDEGLESLSKIITRQKEIATRIYDEVESQSELLDGIGNDMENVDVRLATETRHITEVVRRSSLCGYYLLILVLILILILVLWLKK